MVTVVWWRRIAAVAAAAASPAPFRRVIEEISSGHITRLGYIRCTRAALRCVNLQKIATETAVSSRRGPASKVSENTRTFLPLRTT